MSAMEFSEYVARVASVANVWRWRQGQAAFNVLSQVRPDIADELVGTPLDPFYHDGRLSDFYAFVERAW